MITGPASAADSWDNFTLDIFKIFATLLFSYFFSSLPKENCTRGTRDVCSTWHKYLRLIELIGRRISI